LDYDGDYFKELVGLNFMVITTMDMMFVNSCFETMALIHHEEKQSSGVLQFFFFVDGMISSFGSI